MKGKEEEEHRVWMRLYSGTREIYLYVLISSRALNPE